MDPSPDGDTGSGANESDNEIEDYEWHKDYSELEDDLVVPIQCSDDKFVCPLFTPTQQLCLDLVGLISFINIHVKYINWKFY